MKRSRDHDDINKNKKTKYIQTGIFELKVYDNDFVELNVKKHDVTFIKTKTDPTILKSSKPTFNIYTPELITRGELSDHSSSDNDLPVSLLIYSP